MKASQTPIYRAIERLLLWAVPVVAHLPKAISYEHLGALMIHDIHECMSAVCIAVQSPDNTVKLEAINLVITRMTSVKTTMRVLTQTRHNGAPVVSRKQEAAFLELLNPIARQASAWRNKVSANPRV